MALQEKSIDRHGLEQYRDEFPILEQMLDDKLPLTRRQYLGMAHPGADPNVPLDMELEAELPPPFVHPSLKEELNPDEE